jgi:hypothetical protein
MKRGQLLAGPWFAYGATNADHFVVPGWCPSHPVAK